MFSLTTVAEWDPISKQPTFKSGAVAIKVSNESHAAAKEHHSTAVGKAMAKDAVTSTVTDPDLTGRKRSLECWVGETFESTTLLQEIIQSLVPHFLDDSEAHFGIRALSNICADACDRLRPQVRKYGEDETTGKHAAHVLRDSLFPPLDDSVRHGPLDIMRSLRALQVYIGHDEASLTALIPVSQALWDEEFYEAVLFAASQLERMQAWVAEQIRVRATQSLLVPMKSSGP